MSKMPIPDKQKPTACNVSSHLGGRGPCADRIYELFPEARTGKHSEPRYRIKNGAIGLQQHGWQILDLYVSMMSFLTLGL
jgi:hypothetical protein